MLRSIRYARGRPHPPPLHRRPRAHRRDREGRPAHELPLRRPAGAARARRAACSTRERGELHTVTGVELIRSHQRRPRGPVPARRRPDRRGGDAAPVHRAGGERAGVRGADPVPRPARRRSCRASRGSRPARALVPAQAALAVRVSAARRQLCRVRLARVRSPATRRARAGRSAGAAAPGALALSTDGLAGMEALLRSPLADAGAAGLTERGAREVLAVITVLVRGARRLPAADAARGMIREPRGRLRARRRPGPDRRRRGPRLPRQPLVLGAGPPARDGRAARPRGDARRRPVLRRPSRSASARRVLRTASRSLYLADVYVLPEHRAAGSASSSSARWSTTGRSRRCAGCSTRTTPTASTGGSASRPPRRRLMERPPAA